MGKKRLPVQCWDKSWLCLPVYLWQTILGLSNFSNFLFLHLTLTQPFEIMQRPHLAVLQIDTPRLLSSSLCLRGPTLFFLGNKSSNSSSLLEWKYFWYSTSILGRQAGRETHLGAGYVILGSAHLYSLEKCSPNSTHWNTTLQALQQIKNSIRPNRKK